MATSREWMMREKQYQQLMVFRRFVEALNIGPNPRSLLFPAPQQPHFLPTKKKFRDA
jgi:hypothetical protein